MAVQVHRGSLCVAETQNKEVQSSAKSLTAVRRLRSGMAVSGVVLCHEAVIGLRRG